tara:strand:+ start:9719 stop:10171 length:453 start_codon:yes stop_codon:yes gene_type:complete
MKITDTQNPMPSLEKAIEIAKIVTKLHGNILLFNTVVPMVTATGIVLSKEAQEMKQTNVNKAKGLLIVKSAHPDMLAGEYVALMPQTTPLFSKVVTTDELIEGLDPKTIEDFTNSKGRFLSFNAESKGAFYKKYVLIVVHPTSVACNIDL